MIIKAMIGKQGDHGLPQRMLMAAVHGMRGTPGVVAAGKIELLVAERGQRK